MTLIPAPKGIRVLMYHKVSKGETDFLTVSVSQLESHLKLLQTLGFQYITAQQLLGFYLENKPLPKNPILLTFDDGYLNNLDLAYPILKKHQAKATVFIPTAYVGKTNLWDNGHDPIMTIEQLKNLDPAVFDLALHSHTHRNFNDMPLDEIGEDLERNIAFFKENNMVFTPILAYPYGGRTKGAAFYQLVEILKKHSILAAFRIGNGVNSFKIKGLYEFKRIDIRGTDSFDDFKKKVKKGRVKWL
jgi:peptidoglycan/xylan/chitin deacetylase (PgdA/CDA1 family)